MPLLNLGYAALLCIDVLRVALPLFVGVCFVLSIIYSFGSNSALAATATAAFLLLFQFSFAFMLLLLNLLHFSKSFLKIFNS